MTLLCEHLSLPLFSYLLEIKRSNGMTTSKTQLLLHLLKDLNMNAMIIFLLLFENMYFPGRHFCGFPIQIIISHKKINTESYQNGQNSFDDCL